MLDGTKNTQEESPGDISHSWRENYRLIAKFNISIPLISYYGSRI
jgi:hypothetical protein